MSTNPLNVAQGDGTYENSTVPPPEYRDSLNPVEGFTHYLTGGGQTVVVPFNSINPSGISIDQFPQAYGDLYLNADPKNGDPKTYQIDNSFYTKIAGTPDAFTYGTILTHATGDLSLDAAGNYTFQGTYSSDHDIWDCDSHVGKGQETSWTREAICWPIRRINGTPYRIDFTGSTPVNQSGNIDHWPFQHMND